MFQTLRQGTLFHSQEGAEVRGSQKWYLVNVEGANHNIDGRVLCFLERSQERFYEERSR